MKQQTGRSTPPLLSSHAVHIRTQTGKPLHLPDIELSAGQLLDLDGFSAPIRAGLMQFVTTRQLPGTGTIRFGGIDAGFWPDEELDRYRCVLRPRARQQHNGITGNGLSERTELNLQQAFEFTAFAERLQQQPQATRIVVLDGVLDFLDSITRRVAMQFLSDHVAAHSLAAITCSGGWQIPSATTPLNVVRDDDNHNGQANSSIGMPITTTRISIGRPSRQ